MSFAKNKTEVGMTLSSDSKSEEVLGIIERMPTKFGVGTSILISFIVVLILIFACFVNYPDIVSGDIVITTPHGPVKLIASEVGKLVLMKGNQQNVDEGEYVAYLKSSASVNDVLYLKNALNRFYPDAFLDHPQTTLSTNLSLGEITNDYFTFLGAQQEVYYQHKYDILARQKANLERLLNDENRRNKTIGGQVYYREKMVNLAYKALVRDSLLWRNRNEPDAEFDKSKIEYFSVLQGLLAAKQAALEIEEKTNETKGQLEQLNIKIHEKDLQLRLNLKSSYNDLLSKIKIWEQRFVFLSPMKGKIQFLRFWHNNQFIQPGDEMFSIIPPDNKVYGQCLIPAEGAGRLDVGQEVVIKLENYPYHEFGFLKGVVSQISLTTNSVKNANQQTINHYLVDVKLPNNLQTNHGFSIPFKQDLKGSAEIITKRRTLYSHLFENLSGAVEK